MYCHCLNVGPRFTKLRKKYENKFKKIIISASRLEAWTPNTWTLGLWSTGHWTLGLWTTGRLGFRCLDSGRLDYGFLDPGNSSFWIQEIRFSVISISFLLLFKVESLSVLKALQLVCWTCCKWILEFEPVTTDFTIQIS